MEIKDMHKIDNNISAIKRAIDSCPVGDVVVLIDVKCILEKLKDEAGITKKILHLLQSVAIKNLL